MREFVRISDVNAIIDERLQKIKESGRKRLTTAELNLNVVRKMVNDLDAVERKQGEWLHKEITDDFHAVGQCSVCKERRRIDNFCPNCGAEMR